MRASIENKHQEQHALQNVSPERFIVAVRVRRRTWGVPGAKFELELVISTQRVDALFLRFAQICVTLPRNARAYDDFDAETQPKRRVARERA